MLALCVSLTACGWFLPPPQTRGNRVEKEQLKELVPGTSTKADVTALIGSPTQKAMFDENTWLYITEVTRPRLGQTLGLLDQGVVVLNFDDRGVLTGVKTVTSDDAVPVSVHPAPRPLREPRHRSCDNCWQYRQVQRGGRERLRRRRRRALLRSRIIGIAAFAIAVPRAGSPCSPR